MERHCGFTLIELMFTLMAASVLLAWGIPSFREFRLNAERTREVNQFVQAVYLARSEAAKRDTRVILCRSSNTAATVPSCSGDTRIWTSGYLVFADDGNYSNNVYDAGTDTLLRVVQPAAGAGTADFQWKICTSRNAQGL